jgi:hypothetical protein
MLDCCGVPDAENENGEFHMTDKGQSEKKLWGRRAVPVLPKVISLLLGMKTVWAWHGLQPCMNK